MTIKRLTGWILAMAMTMSITACTKQPEGTEEKVATASATPSAVKSAEPTPVPDFDPSAYLIGMIIASDKYDLYTHAAEHGFLRSAENLGYPAKLYPIDPTGSAEQVVENVMQDGCVGVLVWAEDENMIQIAEQAHDAGLKVIIPYFHTENADVDANLAPDEMDYGLEAARIMCEEILRRGKKEGTIALPTTDEEMDFAQAFELSVQAHYPQFHVERLKGDMDQKQIEAYIAKHEDLAGVMAIPKGTAKQWKDGCRSVQSQLQAQRQAVSTPSATPSDATSSAKKASASATDTANENYKRSAVIIALDYEKENLEWVRDEVIYAVIARPFYDSTAQSMAVMDRLLRVLPTQTDVILNAPILRKSGVNKYIILRREVETWFEGAPKPEKTPTEEPKTTPTATPKAEASTPSKAATPSENKTQDEERNNSPSAEAQQTDEN